MTVISAHVNTMNTGTKITSNSHDIDLIAERKVFITERELDVHTKFCVIYISNLPRKKTTEKSFSNQDLIEGKSLRCKI